MDVLVKLLVGLLVAGQVGSLPSGCRDNGTSYKEGEVVQVGEPCLSCVCRRGALSCSLRVCADYLETLPPGCFLVHKADDCCPHLLCEEGFNPNGIELRTGKKEAKTGCVVNGTAYGEGSALASRDPCEYCYCSEGGLKCVKPRCVRSFEGCKPVYEKSSCCPTHFDCRDAKISLLTSRVKHLGNLNWKLPKDPFRSLPGTDTESQTEHSEVSDESSTALEEKTTEDLAVVTTEEVSEGTTQTETTPSPSDSVTTLSFQTTEDGNLGQESPGVEVTEETTPEVTSQGMETSEIESRNPQDVTEAVENRWNSSQVSDDYDTYDYGEPKLPPSLPNLVIFPFVAADAVVKDDRPELYEEEVEVDRIDDQPVVFKDYFSPPTRTEGGFVPKQPPSEPFYDLPFLRKEPTEPPTEGKQAAVNLPPQASNEPNSSFDDDQRTDLPPTGPLNEVLQTEMASEFFLKGISDRKGQQTKKPVTVTYKNVVVDFYPDYLVTTTRRHPTGDTTEMYNQLQKTTIKPVFINVVHEPLFGSFDEATVLPTAELPAEEIATTKVTPTSTSEESSFFEQFLKTFLEESNTSTMASLTNTKHKYSSKIKSVLTTTAKPTAQNEAVEAKVSPTFSSALTRPKAPSTDLQFTEEPERDSSGFGDLQDENKLSESASEGFDEAPAPNKIHPKPATLLKLAGCNIYGMMYRIGKVITELSGPCVECLCTDFGVQCSPLEC